MLNRAQLKIIVDLIRKQARILGGEKFRPLRLLNTLIRAGEARIPEYCLLPFCSILDRLIRETGFDQKWLPQAAGSLFNKNRRYRTENLAGLDHFAATIEKEYQASSEDSVLAGSAAALVSLYEDPGAFRVSAWSAVLPGGLYLNGGRSKDLRAPPFAWSEPIRFGKAIWRKPQPELLLALLALHIGDPWTPLTPPMWPHLAAATLLYHDRIKAAEVMSAGARLAQREEVERGLAIIARILPEIEKWIGSIKLSIPRWEMKYAIPIAAKRIVLGEHE